MSWSTLGVALGIALGVALVAGAPSATVSAQPIAERPLPAATRTFDHEFTNALFVQPLKSGSMLESDGSDMTVVYLDNRTGSGRVVGRTGSGPLEYRTAGQLLLLPGDTVARFRLPKRSRLLAAGTGVVYVVTKDEDDLEYVNVHRIP